MWNWEGWNNWWSDKELSDFSYLWDNADVSSIFRTINSRANRIPATSGWDVEWMLSASDSPNYNMMWYENSEVFLLYYDKSEWNPYISWDIWQSNPESISWEIRLPKLLLLSWWFWKLDVNNSLIGKNWELPKDDAIVDRQIRWEHVGTPFTIYSTQSTSSNHINYSHDSIFRESDINSPLEFWFTKRSWDTIRDTITTSNNQHWDNADITVIGQHADDISIFNDRFQEIFNKDNVSLRFSLLNLLRTSSGHFYPFLEYYVDFWWKTVSDKYYTIDAEWSFKDFQVNTIVQKPTVKETVLWNFTSIF